MSDLMNGYDLSGGAAVDNGVQASNDSGSMVFDLSGVEENKSFEVIPKGTYEAVVDELEFGESKAGNPMITVKYMLTTPEYENRVIFDYWVLSGKGGEFGLGKLKTFLTRVCPEVDITAFNPANFSDSGVAVGKICKLTLGIQTQKQGEYKGEKRNTVKEVLASDEGSFM